MAAGWRPPFTQAVHVLVPVLVRVPVRVRVRVHEMVALSGSYLTSSGSATESAAILDICLRLKLIDPQVHERGKALLERVVSMLVKLAKSLEGE